MAKGQRDREETHMKVDCLCWDEMARRNGNEMTERQDDVKRQRNGSVFVETRANVDRMLGREQGRDVMVKEQRNRATRMEAALVKSETCVGQDGCAKRGRDDKGATRRRKDTDESRPRLV